MLAAKSRKFRKRKTWEDLEYSLSETQFRRYFRMSRECFEELCHCIEDNVGPVEFKRETFIHELEQREGENSKTMVHAHRVSTGSLVSGELKIAIFMQLLAGGLYLDIAVLFGISTRYIHRIFHTVIDKWFLDDRLVRIDGVGYCLDSKKMEMVAKGFCENSDGVFAGCIGALDGWLVKIKKPSAKRDNVQNPGSYYSRKGFHGVNVQVIVSHDKIILYRNILHRGAEHDSTAFKNGSLGKWLSENWRSLYEKGFYFIEDSAYALKSFLITPFDNAVHGTSEDNFNFFLSSSRIKVECTFGDIDLRWGIFWRPLSFTLVQNVKVIDTCLRLHNFITEFGKQNSFPVNSDNNIFNNDSRRYFLHATYSSVCGGEDDLRCNEDGSVFCGGRPSMNDKQCSEYGRRI